MAYQKKTCRCNETQFVAKKNWNVLSYDFVSDDGVVPSSCTIRLCDVDPLTGEKIADLTVFSGYYEAVNQEVRTNLKQIRPERTKKEIAARKRAGEEYAAIFEQKYGYRPSRDDITLYLDEKEGPRSLLSYDATVNENGESYLESVGAFSNPFQDPFEDKIPVELRALRDVAASLSGRLADVYSALLARYDEDEEKVKFIDLAEKWNVSPAQITKDIKKIGNLVKAKAAELSEE